ncbi:GHMP kinase [bacterium]|nr:GHMP kinase [bacterium]
MPDLLRIVNSAAPIRICDLGGWTDTWFSGTGVVFNIAVYPYAEVQMRVYRRLSSDDRRVSIHVENFGERYDWDPEATGYDRHPLLEAAIDLMGVPDDLRFEVNLYSEAPAGCSTGTSAAVTVALIGALDRLTPGQLTPYEVARAAHRVETEKLTLQAGIQDQLASAYGGISFIEMFSYPHASVSPVYVSNALWWELERRLVLIYLGKSHSSSDVHVKVIKELESEGPASPRMERLRRAAHAGKNALMSGDFNAFGAAMTECTEGQRALHAELVSADAERVIDIARAHGAIGWKVNGAGGGGGSLTLLCGDDAASKRALVSALEKANPLFKHIPIYLSRFGLRVWETPIP